MPANQDTLTAPAVCPSDGGEAPPPVCAHRHWNLDDSSWGVAHSQPNNCGEQSFFDVAAHTQPMEEDSDDVYASEADPVLGVRKPRQTDFGTQRSVKLPAEGAGWWSKMFTYLGKKNAAFRTVYLEADCIAGMLMAGM